MRPPPDPDSFPPVPHELIVAAGQMLMFALIILACLLVAEHYTKPTGRGPWKDKK